jgi:hypothetical protein
MLAVIRENVAVVRIYPIFHDQLTAANSTAQTRRQAPADIAATATGLGIHDKLSVPDAASTTMRQCRNLVGRLMFHHPAAHIIFVTVT